VFTSTVVISAREDGDFGSLREDPDWLVIERRPASASGPTTIPT